MLDKNIESALFSFNYFLTDFSSTLNVSLQALFFFPDIRSVKVHKIHTLVRQFWGSKPTVIERGAGGRQGRHDWLNIVLHMVNVMGESSDFGPSFVILVAQTLREEGNQGN